MNEGLILMAFNMQFEQIKTKLSSLSDGAFLIISGTVQQYIDEELKKRGLVLEQH